MRDAIRHARRRLPRTAAGGVAAAVRRARRKAR
jgi:hypothetical protein